MSRPPMQALAGFERRHPTDKELPDVLAPLSLEQRIEQVIAKYVGGAMSRYYDGETDALTAERRIAAELTAKIKRYALQSAPSPAPVQSVARAQRRRTR